MHILISQVALNCMQTCFAPLNSTRENHFRGPKKVRLTFLTFYFIFEHTNLARKLSLVPYMALPLVLERKGVKSSVLPLSDK